MTQVTEPDQTNPRRLLFELLGVIAVITIIIIILRPVFSGGDPGHRKACLSNLKQLTTVNIMYATDNQGELPPYFTFDGPEKSEKYYDATLSYINNPKVFLCREDSGLNQTNAEGLPDKNSYVHSLALRGIIPEFSAGKRRLVVNEIAQPEQIPLLRDPIRGFGLPEPMNSQPPQDGKPHFFSPHGTRFNLTYLDGHARARTPIDEFKEL